MMFGHDFYHGALRRYVIMFGNLFNEIQVERYSSDGIKLQTISVPIEYSPKQKFANRTPLNKIRLSKDCAFQF